MKSKQKGFTAIEILLVVSIVGLFAAVGWLVFDRQRNKTVQQEPAKNAQQTKTQDSQTEINSTVDTKPTETVNYLVVSGYSVKIPLNDTINGLKLGNIGASGYDMADKSIAIIAPQLDEGWKCEVDKSAGYKGTIGLISITTKAKRAGPSEPLVTKKIGNYTYGFEPGGSSCIDSPAYQQLVDAFKLQFDKLEAN